MPTITTEYQNPFRIGAIRPNIFMGPTPAYWPSAISRKNMGKPAQTNIKTYGIYKYICKKNYK